jgi:comEA protein
MLNLTSQERRVILFLSSVALLGMGLEFLTKRCVQVKAVACINQDIGRVNLNDADKDALIAIPGIGGKLAQEIIEYRRQKGEFNSIEELKNIKGINACRYEKLKDSFFVR